MCKLRTVINKTFIWWSHRGHKHLTFVVKNKSLQRDVPLDVVVLPW